jgi:hypothetical protein
MDGLRKATEICPAWRYAGPEHITGWDEKGCDRAELTVKYQEAA